jgi:hypothetical protein
VGDVVLGAASGTSALPADHSPNLQSINQAHIRLSVAYSLTAFIRLHAGLGRILGLDPASLWCQAVVAN